jgi:Na+-transporting NADH:ubiquinone oxidoreductase subunit NqrA
MTKYFRDDGFENIAQVASTLFSGVVLSGQGPNTTIYLLGANAHTNTVLKQNNNNGTVIAYIAAGNNNFPCTIALTGNNDIFSSGNDAVSLFYYVESGVL